MTCNVENHATASFSTSVIEAIKPSEFTRRDGTPIVEVHIARPYCMVNSIGVAFVTMSKHKVELDLFVERYVAHSSGRKIDNVQR